MIDNDGICIPFDIIYQGQVNPLRWAIWTQTPEERENLQRFGSVILFDSTESNLKNGWLTIPVSIVESNRHILSGGLCCI